MKRRWTRRPWLHRQPPKHLHRFSGQVGNNFAIKNKRAEYFSGWNSELSSCYFIGCHTKTSTIQCQCCNTKRFLNTNEVSKIKTISSTISKRSISTGFDEAIVTYFTAWLSKLDPSIGGVRRRRDRSAVATSRTHALRKSREKLSKDAAQPQVPAEFRLNLIRPGFRSVP
jgi:hypothetical protein